MFFNSVDDIVNIAARTSASVFVVPNDFEVNIKNALVLQPENKSIITIEQIKETLSIISTKQTKDFFVIIRPADLMGDAAANAFLKNLEEPGEKVHFVLVTDSPSKLLPTILSRSAIYFLRDNRAFDNQINASEKDKDLAKRLLAAKSSDLVSLAEEITKKKDGVRSYAMNILSLSIEMLYKSYFITENEVFLKKIPKFLSAYDGVAKNGHVKLQIVSNLC